MERRCVTKVLIVDDEALVRTSFGMMLSAQPDIEVVGEVADGSGAAAACRELRPDVVLMDIRMRHMNGLDATRAILARPDAPRVIVLTTFDLDEYIYEALRSGASGFLLKDVTQEELVNAVRVVAEGSAVLQPSVTVKVVEAFAKGHVTATRTDAGVESLTPRELEVLSLMGRAMSNSEIAQALTITETTTKSHVAHILMKLGLRDRTQAVVRAYESGIIRPQISPEVGRHGIDP
jgi:DNA-binding NarL/FixJ family response regulator